MGKDPKLVLYGLTTLLQKSSSWSPESAASSGSLDSSNILQKSGVRGTEHQKNFEWMSLASCISQKNHVTRQFFRCIRGLLEHMHSL